MEIYRWLRSPRDTLNTHLMYTVLDDTSLVGFWPKQNKRFLPSSMKHRLSYAENCEAKLSTFGDSPTTSKPVSEPATIIRSVHLPECCWLVVYTFIFIFIYTYNLMSAGAAFDMPH